MAHQQRRLRLPDKTLNDEQMEILLRKVLPWVHGTFTANEPILNAHEAGHLVACALLLSHGFTQQEFIGSPDSLRLCDLIDQERK